MWKKQKKQNKFTGINDDISLDNVVCKAENADKEKYQKKLPAKFVPRKTIIPDYSQEFIRNYVEKIYAELNS